MSITPVTSKPSTPTTRTPTSRGVRKDIGMLMFLLAAETAVVSSQITEAGKLSTAIELPDTDSSSGGETDSAHHHRASPTAEDNEMLFEHFKAVLASKSSQEGSRTIIIDAAIVSLVLSFVPWRKVLKMRSINKAWRQAAEQIVTIRRLPGTQIPAAFLPLPVNLDKASAEKELTFVHPSPWHCVVCGFWNGENRVLCGNRACQSPSLTHTGCSRIFLGQLRRDATVPFVQWLVSRVFEAPGELRSVENHRHSVTSRGKGCCWAYFTSDMFANELLGYHRRVFLDKFNGTEGVWVVRPEHTVQLERVATDRGYAAQRPKHLPRNALVVELPATGTPALGKDLIGLPVSYQYQSVEETLPSKDEDRNIESPEPSTNAALIPEAAPPAPESRCSGRTTPESAYTHDPYRSCVAPLATDIWAYDQGATPEDSPYYSMVPTPTNYGSPYYSQPLSAYGGRLPSYEESLYSTAYPPSYDATEYWHSM